MAQKTSFICPYCFERSKLKELEFRCTNKRCKDFDDLPMTRYENGDPAHPLQRKKTFRVSAKGLGVDLSGKCPECGMVTHRIVCPCCHNVLPESTIEGEDKIISVVGSRDTGKSHFVGVLIKELIERVSVEFGGCTEAFSDTMNRYFDGFGNALYKSKKKLPLTITALQDVNNGAYRPLIFNLRLPVKKLIGTKYECYTIAFFDSAGEDLNDEDTMSTVNKYICSSSGIIFLLDPMQIDAVTAQLDPDTVTRASSVALTGGATRSDDIMVRVSNLIRNKHKLKQTDKIDIPVAAVFSKMDAIASLIPDGCTVLDASPHCSEHVFAKSDWYNVSTEIQALLKEWGANSFMQQLSMNYSNYSYFAVSSLGFNNNPNKDGTINMPNPHRIEDPLLWLFSELGMINAK